MTPTVVVLLLAGAAAGLVLDERAGGSAPVCVRGAWPAETIGGWRWVGGDADEVVVYAVRPGGSGCVPPGEGELVYAGPGDLTYAADAALPIPAGTGYALEFRGPFHASVRLETVPAAAAPRRPVLHASLMRAGRTWPGRPHALLSPRCPLPPSGVAAVRLVSVAPPRHQLFVGAAPVTDSRTHPLNEWVPSTGLPGGEFYSACALEGNTVVGVTVCDDCVHEQCSSFVLSYSAEPGARGVRCVGRPQHV